MRYHEHDVEDDVVQCETIQEEKCIEVTSGYTTANDCKKWPREVCTVTKELKTKFNPVTKCEKVGPGLHELREIRTPDISA